MELKLSEMQLDALREVGNIGVSHSATALADIVGERVDMTVPGIRIVPMEDFQTEIFGDREGINYMLLLKGEINSAIVLHFSGRTKHCLSSYMVLGSKDCPEEIDDDTREMMDSAIMEVSNILVSQAADAYSSLLDMRMEPSTPLRLDVNTGGIGSHLSEEEVNPEAILLDAHLTSSQLSVDTKIFIIPFKSSVSMMLERLGVADL